MRYKVNTKAIQLRYKIDIKLYLIKMTKKEKQQLKEKLPYGWVKTIAKGSGFSEAYVRRVMDGLAEKFEIELEALKLAKEHEVNLKKMEKLKSSVL